jgi:DNA-binding MarR family transcriptional regulator
MTAIRELADQVAEMAMRLQRRSRQEASVHGLTGGRLAALASVVAAKRISLSALAESELVSTATMARIVDWLEEGKLVIRVPSTEDRRQVWIVPTMLGRSLAAGSRRRQSSWLVPFLSGLSDRDRATLARAVEILDAAPEA